MGKIRKLLYHVLLKESYCSILCCLFEFFASSVGTCSWFWAVFVLPVFNSIRSFFFLENNFIRSFDMLFEERRIYAGWILWGV